MATTKTVTAANLSTGSDFPLASSGGKLHSEGVEMTKAGKVAAGTPVAQERVGAVKANGLRMRAPWYLQAPAAVTGRMPALYHASLSARAYAFSFDVGGCDLIAEIEGRCARTRRPA